MRGTTATACANAHRLMGFLSTSPLRGTTVGGEFGTAHMIYFYPRPPCGGRPRNTCKGGGAAWISIHVPLAGDDPMRATATWTSAHFYPRPPCGGRPSSAPTARPTGNFYPRPPCGGRPTMTNGDKWPVKNFYPRPPCGGRRQGLLPLAGAGFISIHVPLAGDDAGLF